MCLKLMQAIRGQPRIGRQRQFRLRCKPVAELEIRARQYRMRDPQRRGSFDRGLRVGPRGTVVSCCQRRQAVDQRPTRIWPWRTGREGDRDTDDQQTQDADRN